MKYMGVCLSSLFTAYLQNTTTGDKKRQLFIICLLYVCVCRAHDKVGMKKGGGREGECIEAACSPVPLQLLDI